MIDNHNKNSDIIMQLAPKMLKILLGLVIILPLISLVVGFNLGVKETHSGQILYVALYQWAITSVAILIVFVSSVDYYFSHNKWIGVILYSFIFAAYFNTCFMISHEWVYYNQLDAENLHAFIWFIANIFIGCLLLAGFLSITRNYPFTWVIIFLGILIGLSSFFLLATMLLKHKLPAIVFPAQPLRSPLALMNLALYLLLIKLIFSGTATKKFPIKGIIYFVLGQCVMSLYITFGLIRHYDTSYFGPLFLQLCSYFMVLLVLVSRYVSSYSSALEKQEVLRSEKEKFKQLADRDPLTNLYNRRSFEEAAERLLALARRQHTEAALFFLDIDNFKTISKLLGHGGGDQILQRIAEVFNRILRLEDVYGRLGGDEFVIFISPTKKEEVQTIAEKILKSFSEIYFINNTLSVSIGIAMFPQEGDSLQSLLQSADQAMYKAKQAGKRQYCFSYP